MSDENRQMDHKVVFEPYDMDTALGTNNSGVLMFSPYLEDTDTVSSVIAGGDSGGSEAPVYNAQDSVLWNNLRDAFRSELVQMYRNLRASNGPWQYNAIEKRFEDHQAIWPEAIFNEDAWVKYIIPLVDPVTVDDDTGELIRTDRYLTMLQGSKKEQRKWWLYNRLRYLDSKYDTGNASSNIINIRFFNGGVLKLKTAIPMYAAVSFGGGTTPEIKRTEANTEVSFTYVPGTGVTEMETWIHSGNLITDVGDLSVFYPNECDFSKASLLKRLKIGDSTSGYSNANLTTINVRNSPLLEHIDCRNCPRLGITVNLENSPRLVEAYFDGTSITGLDLADGCAIETLHLPASVTALTLLNLTKLNEFVIPSYANIARFMFDNIDTTVVNPVSVLSAIRPNSQVNIQGLYLELADAEAIGDFFDLVDTMSGVTRERNTTTGEWIYHNEEKAVIAGEVHTEYLTGDEMEVLNARYPYVRTTADHITTTLKYYNWDGSTLLETQTIIDGGDGTYSGTPTRADDADWRYTFIGWNTQPDKYVADPNATLAVNQNRNVYAAYSRTSIAVLKYYTYDGSTLLYTETIIGGGNGTYAGTPARPSDPRYTYTFAGWATVPNGQADVNAIKNVTTHKSVYAAYTAEGQKYTVKFYNGSGTLLQQVQNVLYGGTAQFTGTIPVKTGVNDPELYEFIGWNPSNIDIQGDTNCYPMYKYLGIITRRLIERNVGDAFENSEITSIGSYAFTEITGLKTISFPNVTRIGKNAFSGCYNIKTMSFPELITIDDGAFRSAGSTVSTSVYFPKVETIGISAFQSAYFEYYSFPNLISIDSYAFSSAAVVSFSAENLEYIGPNAFYYCRYLNSINAPKVKYIGDYAFYANVALSSVYFPELTSIGGGVFGACKNLTSFDFPSLTSILGNQPFNASFVSSINIPNVDYVSSYGLAGIKGVSVFNLPKVSYLGEGAFNGNSSARTYIFGPSLSSIPSNCFADNKMLEVIDFPAITYMGSAVFAKCNRLKQIIIRTESSIVSGVRYNQLFSSSIMHPYLSIYVPDSMLSSYLESQEWMSLSSRIFGMSEYVSSLSKIVISNISSFPDIQSISYYCELISDPNATIVSSSMFSNYSILTEINLPNVYFIDNNAFGRCSLLTSISLPNVSCVGINAFQWNYYMKSIYLPAIETISSSAFYFCDNLNTVYLGSSIGSIHKQAFSYCQNLQSVFIYNSTTVPSTFGTGSLFYEVHSKMKIYVPENLLYYYKTSPDWSRFSNIIFSIPS